MTTRTSYTAGHFELVLDGAPTTAYLKSIDGGWTKHAVVDEPIGPDNHRIKHASVAEVDPISFDFGLSGCNPVLQWIQASWRKEYKRCSGQITHANFNQKATFEHHFSDALLLETTFPALDGSSKEAGYAKVKFQPEAVKTMKVGGAGGSTKQQSSQDLKIKLGSKQKMWLCSAFRLNIDGIDDMKYANKIESFTVKQGIKKMYVGAQRYPEILPTKLEFPNLSGTISLEYADTLLAWHDEYVAKGKADTNAQRTGALEFLSPDRSKVLFRIALSEVGLVSANIMSSTANSDQIKRVKFELYVGKMDLDGAGALGLE